MSDGAEWIAIAWPLIRGGQLVGLRWDVESDDGAFLGHLERRSGARRLEVFDAQGRRVGEALGIRRGARMLDADDAEGGGGACG